MLIAMRVEKEQMLTVPCLLLCTTIEYVLSFFFKRQMKNKTEKRKSRDVFLNLTEALMKSKQYLTV